MKRVKLRLAGNDWAADNSARFAIYNANYAPSGEKTTSRHFPWRIQRGHGDIGNGFPTQQDATDYLREHLANAEAQVSE